MKVVILSGGFSEEQHASRKSAAFVFDALIRLGHNPYIVEYDINCIARIKEISPDTVFHLTQGKHHSDGAAQAILELIGIPYTGSRPHAAAIINYKTLCKKIWICAGIQTPEFFEYSYDEYKELGYAGFLKKAESAGISLPIVVKVPTQGSRFGMSFVKDEITFHGVLDGFQYEEVLLCERYIPGRCITQGILEIDGKLTTLPPIEIIDTTNDEFKFYYEDTISACPEFSPEESEKINSTTLTAARLVGASGVGRLDYHLNGKELYLLEINASPGLRMDCSDLIKCSEAAGYTYDELISMILQTAI